ncbi:MAG: SpoVG family protein [Endomicrobium sp.]|jgi:DNA-binding cell septation regulator SpoVG|nr:SpoVG family protein [Endomicrobium sp.]
MAIVRRYIQVCFVAFAVAVLFNAWPPSLLFAGMKVTEIKKNNGFYEIVLNNDIKIFNILLNNKRLIFPQYERKVRIYKQFSILKRDFNNYLLYAVTYNKTFLGKCITSFKVNKMLVLKNSKGAVKAFASVIFDDDIEVECRIISGKNGLWTAWPSCLNNNVWVKNFIFVNLDLQKRVEKRLIASYTSALNG